MAASFSCREIPVILSDQIDSLAASAIKGMPNQTRLTNKHPVPIRIDEIRIQPTDFQSTVNGPAQLPLEIKIEVAGQQITDDFVTAYLLGPVASYQYSTGYNPTWVWKLKKPFFLASGERIRVWYRSDGAQGSMTNLRVAFCGRTHAQPLPAQRWLPWITTFRGSVYNGGSSGLNVESTQQSHLHNPFDMPLFVERFNATLAVNGYDGLTDYSVGGGTNYAGIPNATLVRAHTSAGSVLVRDLTPFDALFYGAERSWRVNAELGPRAFYVFTFQSDYSSFSQDTPAICVIMNMIGYREVK